MADNKKTETVIGEQVVRYDKAALALGVERDGNAPWLELSKEELLILEKMLTMPVTSDGASAASHHEGLAILAQWAGGGAAFLAAKERGNVPSLLQ